MAYVCIGGGLDGTAHESFIRLGGLYMYAIPIRVPHLFSHDYQEAAANAVDANSNPITWERVSSICKTSRGYLWHLKVLCSGELSYIRKRQYIFCKNCMGMGPR